MRRSNSTDPAGTSTDCLASNLVGSIVDLGTVAIGTATTVQLQWNQAGKTFCFSRDNGAASGSVSCTDSDATPPSVPYKQLSTRMDVQNCLSGPRVSGLVDANVDNIFVNKSAAP